MKTYKIILRAATGKLPKCRLRSGAASAAVREADWVAMSLYTVSLVICAAGIMTRGNASGARRL